MDHVAIDLGKAQSRVSWVKSETGELVRMRIQTKPERLRAVFGDHEPLKVLLEASTASEWVAQLLESLGHEVIVADPNCALMHAGRGRAKTDRLDADALVTALMKGNCRKAHRVSEAQRALRIQVGARETLVRARARLVTSATSQLWSAGLEVGTGSTEGFVKRVGELEVPRDLKRSLAPLLRTIRGLDAEIKRLDREIERWTRRDPRARRLMTTPGVGPVTAAAFISSLDTPERFQNAGQVGSYIGLVPREWSSSAVELRGPITKQGPKRVRWLLVQAAWSILTFPKEETKVLRDWGLGIAGRSGRSRAVVAMARKLSRIPYALWRDERDFDPAMLVSPKARTVSPA